MATLPHADDGDAAARQAELIAVARAQVGSAPPTAGAARSDRPDGEATADPGAEGELGGTRIGAYKLLQLLGRGGFGEVYMAEQAAPVRRKVALKLVKLGMDTREVIARFEAERQALALMDHPNIARVFDAGATETGRPYFVMELVRGVPITRFCDERRLSIAARLRLFQDVCHAVQHAHQKGIIHRDLKPSNVMVTLHDERPVVKVIDFGIAKAIQEPLTDKTLFTQYGQFIGTPAYMSPEQAQLNAIDVDTRSDVYSLGVLLYELLTGTTPFDAGELLSAGHDELRRIIREVEPPRPSTRLDAIRKTGGCDAPVGRSAESSAALAETRAQSGPASDPAGRVLDTSGAVREWRRSPRDSSSAAAIAAVRGTDPPALIRTLRGELDWIVMRCLEKDRSRRYATANGLAIEIQRYLGGEPVAAAPPGRAYRIRKFVRRNRSAVVVTAAFATTLAVATIAMALVAGWALRERARAGKESARARAINDLVTDALALGDPQQGGEQGALVRDAMQRVLAELDAGELRDQPETEAALRLVISRVLLANGLGQQALESAQAALAINRRLRAGDDPEVATSLARMANCLEWSGRSSEALEAAEAALAMCRRLYAGDHAETADNLLNVAACLISCGRHDQAGAHCQEALAMYRRLYGAEHSGTLRAMDALGHCLRLQGRLSDARREYEAALRIREERYSGAHHELAESYTNVAVCLKAIGDMPGALSRFLMAQQIVTALYRGDHPDVATSVDNVGFCLVDMGAAQEALPNFEAARRMRERLFPGDHHSNAVSLNNVAYCLEKLGRSDEAGALYQAALEMLARTRAADHPEVTTVAANIARWAVHASRADLRVGALRAVLQVLRKAQPGLSHDFARIVIDVVWGAEMAGFPADSAALLRECAELFPRVFPQHEDGQTVMQFFLARALHEGGDPEQAEPLYRTALESYQSRHTGLDWHAAAMQTWLARCQGDLGRFAEAEPLLLAAYESLCLPQSTDVWRCPENLVGLVNLYEAWQAAEPGAGHERQAAEWRARLAAYRAGTQATPPAEASPNADAPGPPVEPGHEGDVRSGEFE